MKELLLSIASRHTRNTDSKHVSRDYFQNFSNLPITSNFPRNGPPRKPLPQSGGGQLQ